LTTTAPIGAGWKYLPVLLATSRQEQEEASMIERRKAYRRRYKAHMHFPANDHQGNVIMSERRQHPTRRAYDISSIFPPQSINRSN
jgi:hypothetical protein